MVKQTVTRTRPKGNSCNYEPAAFERLSSLLKEGYRVAFCTPIGEELEYILEKEIED